MGGGKGLSSWGGNSQIDHGVADDPMGVFRRVDTALSKEARQLRHQFGPKKRGGEIKQSHFFASRSPQRALCTMLYLVPMLIGR